jgi:hypothetical protein
MAFDIETFIDGLSTSLKTKLNQKITALNTEKGDALLDQIPEKAWIFGSLDDTVKNFADFAFFFVDSIDTKVAGPILAEEYTIEIDLFIYDRQDSKIQKRILRLHRALREAIAETWDKVGMGYDRASIESLTPIDVKLNNSSYYHKIVGVSLKFSISN